MRTLVFTVREVPPRPRGDEYPDYVNPCCVGGDLVVERVLPLLRARSERVEHGQEDWGWYAWGYRVGRRIAVDSACDDEERGVMVVRVSIHQRGPWWTLFREREIDDDELRALTEEVAAALRPLAAGPVEEE